MTAKTTITVFSPYPFKIGEKIYIDDGPRKGDWIVASVTEHKVHLRCPVSGKVFKWDRFCHQTHRAEVAKWPQPD
jgi:hypothetical protein